MTGSPKTAPTFTRVHDRKLSLWQSAVSQTVKKQLSSTSIGAVLDHPLMKAVNTQIAIAKSPGFDQIDPKQAGDETRQAYLAHLTFQFAIAVSGAAADPQRLRQIFEDSEVPFSDDDYAGWASCWKTYYHLYEEGHHVMPYNDWNTSSGGNGNIDYGVIDYTLPADAKVAIIGDWGTGLYDAQCLLQDIVDNHAPSAIIHLGDIYYSGTTQECADSFKTVIENVYDNNRNVPVFTIPGNHDYYDWGIGYYGMLPDLNTNIPKNSTASAAQAASYFCLRTADSAWQFLAMDTGYNDSDPTNAENAWCAGPALQPDEITWHQDKLANFTGTTILLSHHQLFSANNKINGEESQYYYLPYLNANLYGVFSDYFSKNIALWLWGHEHNFAMYQDGLWGLAKGRLVGCSAYEEFVSSDPYTVNYQQVPYNAAAPADQLGTTTVADQAFYNHAYAIIDFSVSPPTIGYYQYPAFYTGPTPTQGGSLICSETIVAPDPPSQGAVASGTGVAVLGQEALYVSALYDGYEENYPTLGGFPASAVQIVITAVGSSNADLSDGDTVTLQTTETAAGSSNYIGTALSDGSCYYVADDSGYTQWTINKKSTADGTTINMYGAVYFTFTASDGGGTSVLCSYPDDGAMYLTVADVSSNSIYYWRLMPGSSISS